MRLGDFNFIMHNLRCFLCRAVAVQEAARLNFNFGGLSDGWNEHATIRRSTHALRFFPGMPSLLSGASWTRWNSWKSGYDTSPICVRCNAEDESLGHRLWRCSDNNLFRQWLNDRLGSFDLGAILDTLPRCLTRCALIPANCPLTPDQAVAVQQYIAMVNHHAARCYDCHKKQAQMPEPQIEQEALTAASLRLRKLSIKPIKKDQGSDLPACRLSAQNYQVTCFDGSHVPDSDDSSAKAGAGLVVAISGEEPSCYSMPVVTDRRDGLFRGATQLSNNVAELTGAILCLEHAATLPAGRVVIGYDSEYARRTITREWRARRNARIIAHGRRALEILLRTHQVDWLHVGSHTGHALNELADHHASLGADGIVQLPAWCRADSGPGF